ncbi:sensor histidine kinase [Roseisolibacter sp. H3M3-2]|uniref:HAMP domain-containing sensor histidine kinase n=1 Tax=Roseisolibacter sp. H3M3-2 TaxID=3031323 RepID=UPI0023DA487F|nr:sensor histidine kinase [Roseisolibacter sp. H3M3-2]MDF1503883.1 sensor histidine kinase [Roseisolibacter sp. H3M3-2]
MTDSPPGPGPRPPQLERAPRPDPAAGRDRARPRWQRAILGVPLTAKLAGANLTVLLLAVAALVYAAGRPDHLDAWLVGGALALGLAANSLLVRYALRPVWELEHVASRVWAGDFAARVPGSDVADREMSRVGRTFNLLLDAIARDRERMRALALQTVRAQDDERSRIARELHDSTAQTIAALTYQLTAAARQAGERGQPDLEAQLRELREQTGELLEEVRLLSHAIHPRVLDDLGLVPALEWLARQTREHTALDVHVDADVPADAASLSDATASALYRVAQEALRNVERHARAGAARLTLRADAGDVILDVADDGAGFDLAEAEARRPGMGLFSMRERLGLVGGTLDVRTAPGRGTRVRARAPLDSLAPRHAVPFSPPATELR